MIVENDLTFFELKEEDLKKVTEIKSLSLFDQKRQKSQKTIHRIARCKNLEQLTLYTNGIYQWPSEFFDLKHIQYIYLYGLYKDAAFFRSIGALQSLKTLRLSNCNLPPNDWGTLTDLKNLEYLYLNKCAIRNMPTSFNQLKKLKVLDIRQNTALKKIPAPIYELDQLQELYADSKLIRKLNEEERQLLSKLAYYYRHSATEKKYVRRFQGAFPKFKLSDAHRFLALNLLANDEELVKQLQTRDLLLDLTTIPRFDIIRIGAIDYLGSLYGPDLMDDIKSPTSELTICGKIHTNKNDLRKRLKEVNINYKTALGSDTTHIVIGQSSKLDLGVLKSNTNIKFLTEKMLNDYLDSIAPQYLVADEELSSNLKQLLLANDPVSIELALQLMKEGGMPKSIINELFVSWGGQPLGKLKDRLAKLLRQISSTALGDYVKKKVVLYYIGHPYYRSESSLYTLLRKLEVYEELDTIKIGEMLYKITSKGTKYLLTKMPSEQKIAFLKSLCEGTTLNLSHKELTSLPKELGELTFLTKLNLKGNRLRSYPKQLAQLVNLKELDISNNIVDKGKRLPGLLPHCKIIQ